MDDNQSNYEALNCVLELPQTIIVPLNLIELGRSKIQFRPFIC